MKKIPFVLLMILCCSLPSCSNDDDVTTTDPTIVFTNGTVEVNTFTRSFMQNTLPSYELDYYDSVHEKQKKLRAFELKDVLSLAYDIDLETLGDATFTFKALDGFQDSATNLQVNESGGYIAFEDLDVEGIDNWELVATENNNNPAPFYVVWINTEQTPADGYPWPYQLFSVELSIQ